MKKIICEKKSHQDTPLGKLCSLTSGYRVFGAENMEVTDKDGNCLAVFLKNVLSKREIEAGKNLIRYKRKSNCRGMAAGINEQYKKEANLKGGLGAANSVYSSIVGYMESSQLCTCRMTVLTRENKELFQKDSCLLFKKVSSLYKQFAPKYYHKQLQHVRKVNPNMVIPNTVYTTATVNVDFRTHTHRDKGDFVNGLGNLIVFNERGKRWSGSEFLLPDYKIAFRLQEGDVLFVDVHKIHCNAQRKGSGRISLVLYARQNLDNSCQGMTKEQLEKGAMSRNRGRLTPQKNKSTKKRKRKKRLKSKRFRSRHKG